MTKRLDLMRFLIAKHRDLYAAHIADAILGVEAISMSRLTMWESLMCGDTTASPPTYGDGGMAAAVRLAELMVSRAGSNRCPHCRQPASFWPANAAESLLAASSC